MGEKRNYSDEAGPSANKRFKGAHRQHPDFKKNTPRPESSTWAKKRVRTIERRLRNPDGLPGHVQVEMRRELASLNDQLSSKQEKKQRAQMISKYHMIRFFERKKAERLQKQLTRRLRETADADERAEIETDLAIAEVDALYARYHPFMEAYVSLYPPVKGQVKEGDEAKEAAEEEKQAREEGSAKYGTSSAAKALRAPRPAMWELIKKTSDEGGVKALEKVRDRPASGGQAAAGEDIGAIAAAKEGKKEKEKGKKDKSKDKGKDKGKDKSGQVQSGQVKVKKEKAKAEADNDGPGFKAKESDVPMADDDDDEEGGFFE